MNTYKEFSEGQQKILKELGFENTNGNTWCKCYGCDDYDCGGNDVGFAIILNPLYDIGKVKINYYNAFEQIVDEIDDTGELSQIYRDITALIEHGLITE